MSSHHLGWIPTPPPALHTRFWDLRIWGIKGFSDCSGNDTEGFWSPKTADAPTSGLEGLDSSPEGRAALRQENCERQADAPEDPFPGVVELAELRLDSCRRISRNVADLSPATNTSGAPQTGPRFYSET